MQQRLDVVPLRGPQPRRRAGPVAAAAVDGEPEVPKRRSPLSNRKVGVAASCVVVVVALVESDGVVPGSHRWRVVWLAGGHRRDSFLALDPTREPLVPAHLRATGARLGRHSHELVERVLAAAPPLERPADGARRAHEGVPEDARAERGGEQHTTSAPVSLLDGALHRLGDVPFVRRPRRLVPEILPRCQRRGRLIRSGGFGRLGWKALLPPPSVALCGPRRTYLVVEMVEMHHLRRHTPRARASRDGAPSLNIPAVSKAIEGQCVTFSGGLCSHNEAS